ncbi:MAG: hypothetical protein AB7F99_04545 [Vicinamibacterales bacterium]
MSRAAGEPQSLLALTASPVAWAVHFLLSYVTAAIWCAKVGGSLGPVRIAVAAYTTIALAIIAIVAWQAWRAHTYGGETAPHDADTPEDRHRFMGLATLLLSGLSGVAVCYAALVIVFVGTCQ